MKRLFLLLVLLAALSACAPARASESMTLFAVNVGKADALLLFHGETTYLIDTGSAESWGQLSCALRMLGVDRLDGVIVTHTDKDHIGGVPMLAASSVEVGGWYASRYYTELKESEHPVLLAAQSRGQRVTWLSDGDTLPFGDGSLTVLAPAAYSEEENDNSLVLLAEGAGGRMLLMGDAEMTGERALLNAHPDLVACQVLKVGHHGGGDATSKALVTLVKPQIAVISTSTAERKETPSPTVLQRLLKAGADVAVTQDGGAGVLVTLENGQASMSVTDWTALPEPAAGVCLAGKDAENDVVCLANEGGAAVDLSGWFLRSERGGEAYIFPEGTALEPGATLTLGTLTTKGPIDLIWQEKNVWHNKKDDVAVLYDAYGRAVDRIE